RGARGEGGGAEAGAGGGARHRPRRVADGIIGPRADRGPGDGDPAAPPTAGRGRTVHQVGLPFHWAFAGEVVGGNANDLTSIVADPNVSMHEAKAFACEVRAGRLAGRQPAPTGRPGRGPGHGPVPDPR